MTRDILFIAHRVPYPPNRGDKIRSWHMLRHMASFARVHLAALYDDPRDADHLDTLRRVCASVAIVPRSPARSAAMARALISGRPASVEAFASASLKSHIDATLAAHPIDTIFAFSGQMAQFVPSAGVRRFVMDFVDMDSAKFAAFAKDAKGPSVWANRAEAARLKAFETATARRADLSLFVSRAEAALFCAETGIEPASVGVIENGIDIAAFDPLQSYGQVYVPPGPLIVFTGQMDYRPNIDAVIAFAHKVLPIVRAAHRDASFAIVGRNPSPAVEALRALPGVMVTGEVPDTRGWLAAASVVVAPLLLARGVQNKVLEAMAMAKPVIASPAAATGIDARADAELIVAPTHADEAAAVIGLLSDPDRRNALGKAARARIEARYTWDAQLAGLQSVITGPLAKQAAA